MYAEIVEVIEEDDIAVPPIYDDDIAAFDPLDTFPDVDLVSIRYLFPHGCHLK